MTPDLTDEQTAALVRLLSDTINNDRYPLSPRIQPRLLMNVIEIWLRIHSQKKFVIEHTKKTPSRGNVVFIGCSDKQVMHQIHLI